MIKLNCKSIEELPMIVTRLLPEILAYKIIYFNAAMGAGKTTTIKAICMALGVKSTEISSPTYSLVNEYQGTAFTIYHFDFYRLKNITEAYDFGLEEYFNKNAICFMEWPEIVEPLIPLPYLKINIGQENEERIFQTEIIKF